jgi:sorbitol-specific phosphotransferase system component IIBC
MTEQQFKDAARDNSLQPMPFHPPEPPSGLQGCTGIARVGLCIRCDRLGIPGEQIAPQAKRGPLGVYACVEQWIGGVHVGSVAATDPAEKTAVCGGVATDSTLTKGVSA